MREPSLPEPGDRGPAPPAAPASVPSFSTGELLAGERPPRPRRIAPLRWTGRGLSASGDFLRRVVNKAGDDDIFFMAGAIAFNVIIALVPLLLAMLGIAAAILRFDVEATERLIEYVIRALPPVSPEFVQGIRTLMAELMQRSAELISIATILLIWVATRLIGTLRTALRQTFDIHQDRGIVAGKIFDLKMVVVAGALFALNVGLTVAMEVVTRFGFEVLGLEGRTLRAAEAGYARFVAFFSIWTMFLLIYRYLPARRVRWSTCLIAATFTATLFELMKLGFAWYITNYAQIGAIYGGLGTVVILFLWIYYTAVAFILGGEVGQVATMQRIRKRQKERLG